MNALQELQEFKFSDNKVRIILIDDDPWWVIRDVCSVLGIVDHHQAFDRVDEDERGKYQVPTPGGIQEAKCVNESGLFSLILRSDKPEAKAFKKWVTSEVLPQIRLTGSYSTRIPKTHSAALRAYAAEIEAHEQTLLRAERAETALIEAAPKVEKYDTFLEGKNLHSLDIAAKNLGIGRTKMTTALREKKVFYKPSDNSANHVYQKYLDLKYFQIKMFPITKNGVVTNYPQIYVTAKGLSFLQGIFRKGEQPISVSE